jgi:hypothetical protein
MRGSINAAEMVKVRAVGTKVRAAAVKGTKPVGDLRTKSTSLHRSKWQQGIETMYTSTRA